MHLQIMENLDAVDGSGRSGRHPASEGERFLGIDVGAESVKIVELCRHAGVLETACRLIFEHGKCAQSVTLEKLAELQWPAVTAAGATGRLAGLFNLQKIPVQAAQAAALDFRFPGLRPIILISIGSRGFSVLTIRSNGRIVFRENSRCSQGTGNFLGQLAARFGLSVEEACREADPVAHPALLSGRCPVILKTDMTHLGNKGERRDRILAGLLDAVCENVQILVKPGSGPRCVVLAGGLARASRVRRNFRQYLDRHGLESTALMAEDSLFLEATGAAIEAARLRMAPPPLADLAAACAPADFEEVMSLRQGLKRVRRLSQPMGSFESAQGPLLLGFDIGSTGSKLVALDMPTGAPVWEQYCATNGHPIRAAQELSRRLLDQGGLRLPILAFGVTGSGREIVGSVLATCYGNESVRILNEIAAHAAGALYYDPQVDTIFEIGGQDAKYVKLLAGQVCDAAMNEACSAGTGSFIEEQGCRLAGIDNPARMERVALDAGRCVSLGQHCSVFMAEAIDAAIAAGRPMPEIVAGVYDSVIQNYLNRVKGNRPTGRRIFCQGMPFSSDALAGAAANRAMSDITIPPNPGTVGALGIALLAAEDLRLSALPAVRLEHFLSAAVVGKDEFHCRSTRGCGGEGNKCRIEQLTVMVGKEKQSRRWGGSCSLYDRAAGAGKLPDLAPDPFRERRELVQDMIARCAPARPGRPVIAITDEFVLKNLFPFFATYLHELGFDLHVQSNAGRPALRRGIEENNVRYCAPLELYAGMISRMVEIKPDYLFCPMLRDIPKSADEPHSISCTLAQASADIMRLNLRGRTAARVLTPVMDMGAEGTASGNFRRSCFRLARSLRASARAWQRAFDLACAAQSEFASKLTHMGSRALDFALKARVTPVVVLGRPYTIHNNVLNSNVPDLLRELGVVAIPVDCYPVGADVPVFKNVYWGYSQMNLRAAHQIRHASGIYSVYCSNYSCGPDSFNLHFYCRLMEGKPFAIIETDGHSGDAGTKTRLEAFLSCVQNEQRRTRLQVRKNGPALHDLAAEESPLGDITRGNRLLLIPRLGAGAEVLACTLCAEGMRAEALPIPDREAIRIGRRHTSGKECLPMTATLGSCLKRIYAGDSEEKYALLMPKSYGPCRFGVYNLYDRLIFSEIGLRDRVAVIAPAAGNYFKGLPHGLALKLWAAVVAEDILLDMLHATRPLEKKHGFVTALYGNYFDLLNQRLQQSPAPPLAEGIEEIFNDVFGLRSFLIRAAHDFAAAADGGRDVPTVAVTGEIYVRCDPGSNDRLIERLEERGMRVKLASAHEWLEYTDWSKWRGIRERRRKMEGSWFAARLSSWLKRAVLERLHAAVRAPMGWQKRTRVCNIVSSAEPYLSSYHRGEAILTIGGPLQMHGRGEIAGAICVAPLECLPNKVAESQLYHACEDTGLIALALYLNGDPMDPESLDNFAYEVKKQHARISVWKTGDGPR
jgi:activator of 2-hydroxyglutaryl-CoA dehydratase/predicted nucleotide-binding protein (sugar kinase/HSP70/actin superfamily)